MPHAKEASIPSSFTHFPQLSRAFPFRLLQNPDAANDGQRLHLTLCGADDTDQRKDTEQQGKDSEDAGNDQHQHRADLNQNAGQHVGQNIENHHENWDGTGYPSNKKGNEIPITSQIILIVDSYFAMISYRPYRKAYTIDEAIEEIKTNANKKYSPELVEAFIYSIDEFKKM